jgi:glutathione S-transferase
VANTLDLEQRADSVIGVHVRRLAYAEMLTVSGTQPKAEVYRDTSTVYRLAGHVMWPVTRRLMLRALDIRPGAGKESRAILEAELDWLDRLLADGRPYMAGDRLSRADLAVASLLVPFARPKEIPVFRAMKMPPALMADVARWGKRPVMGWVRAQYRAHRYARAA